MDREDFEVLLQQTLEFEVELCQLLIAFYENSGDEVGVGIFLFHFGLPEEDVLLEGIDGES